MGEGPPVQPTTLQLEEAGDRERHTTEETASAAKNVVRSSQKTPRVQKRGKKKKRHKRASRVEEDGRKIDKKDKNVR